MKKVRKNDLINLIAQFYCDFIRTMPISEIVSGQGGVKINIDSIYISVIDYNQFCSESEQEILMQRFAEQIEAITFGNLKVTYKGCSNENGNAFSLMYIANAYDVIE